MERGFELPITEKEIDRRKGRTTKSEEIQALSAALHANARGLLGTANSWRKRKG